MSTAAPNAEYDAIWYAKYDEYLKHPQVRLRHDYMFRMFVSDAMLYTRPLHVLDIGCGTCEFAQFLHGRGYAQTLYLGLDKNLSGVPNPDIAVQGDFQDSIQLASEFNCFVSLFATEIHLPIASRHALYEALFQNPSIQCGLVTGLHYRGDSPTYYERGGFSIQQAVNDKIDSSVFSETRLTQEVPPGFFVDRFTEVWKFFFRKRSST